MLVYLGLFVVLSSVTAVLFTQVVQLQAISRSRSQLSWQATRVFLDISQEIKAASSVDSPFPGVTANTLSLDGGAVQYQLNNNQLEKVAGGETMVMTRLPLTVETLSFANYSSTDNPGVEVKLTLRLPPPMPNLLEIREEFQTSAFLRH
jgi:hypothetical protein